MHTDTPLYQDNPLPCESCIEEIPVSEAKSDEASDYVVFLYGLECYTAWREQDIGKNTRIRSGLPLRYLVDLPENLRFAVIEFEDIRFAYRLRNALAGVAVGT